MSNLEKETCSENKGICNQVLTDGRVAIKLGLHTLLAISLYLISGFILLLVMSHGHETIMILTLVGIIFPILWPGWHFKRKQIKFSNVLTYLLSALCVFSQLFDIVMVGLIALCLIIGGGGAHGLIPSMAGEGMLLLFLFPVFLIIRSSLLVSLLSCSQIKKRLIKILLAITSTELALFIGGWILLIVMVNLQSD